MEDLDARQSNIQQVADYIETWSRGNAVIVIGDTNSRYTRSEDTAIRTGFGTQNGLTDPWVQLHKDGINPTAGAEALLCDNPAESNDCEIVDKLFYRGSKIVNLEASSFTYDGNSFLNIQAPNVGAVLSDHNPILVDFSWTLSPSFRQSPFSGGPHGTWFTSLPTLPANPTASIITFSGAERLDSVGLELTDGTTFSYGGTGGTADSLTLASGESWTQTELCIGQRNDQTRNFYIQATTSEGRTLQAGTRTENCDIFEADEGFAVVGFMGQAGDEIDQLALIYAPVS